VRDSEEVGAAGGSQRGGPNMASLAKGSPSRALQRDYIGPPLCHLTRSKAERATTPRIPPL
jgi:hypothetical protein